LRIVDGATGETINSVGSDELAPFGSAAPLLIDIDGDGKAEIAYPHYDQKSIVVLNFDGSKRWVLNTGYTLSTHRGFSAFDMDKDGKAEIFVGNAAYSEDASAQPVKKWQAASAVDSGWEYMMSLDPAHPDKAFAVTNRGLFDASGALVYSLTGQGATVADIDGIPGMELVESGSGQLRIRDALSGALKTDVDLNLYNDLKCTGGIGGGPATLGDFDGDPATVEIALATGRYLTIFNSAGQLIAKSPTQDCSSLATGISSFDFNGDGKPEILYGDEEYFRIFEMHEGELRVIWSTPNPSGTLNEYPVVADVDGNGSSEIVVASNNYAVNGFYTDPSEAADKEIARAVTGVRVFESAKANSWMPTRKVWNQFDYNPAFVTDALRPVSSTPLSGSFTTRIFRRNAQLGVFEQKCE
jgi:hypothetical protein